MGASEILTGLRPVFSAKSTTTTNCHPLTAPVDGRRVGSVRVGYELRSTSGLLELRVFQQTSNDGLSWNAPATLSGYTTYNSTLGFTYGTTFASVTAAPYVRFGLECRNTSGTKLEAALGGLILDLTFS